MGRESSALDLARSLTLGHDLNVEMRRNLNPRLSKEDHTLIQREKLKRIKNGLRESKSTAE